MAFYHPGSHSSRHCVSPAFASFFRLLANKTRGRRRVEAAAGGVWFFRPG